MQDPTFLPHPPPIFGSSSAKAKEAKLRAQAKAKIRDLKAQLGQVESEAPSDAGSPAPDAGATPGPSESAAAELQVRQGVYLLDASPPLLSRFSSSPRPPRRAPPSCRAPWKRPRTERQ
jgi:hypothetical protein